MPVAIQSKLSLPQTLRTSEADLWSLLKRGNTKVFLNRRLLEWFVECREPKPANTVLLEPASSVGIVLLEARRTCNGSTKVITTARPPRLTNDESLGTTSADRLVGRFKSLYQSRESVRGGLSLPVLCTPRQQCSSLARAKFSLQEIRSRGQHHRPPIPACFVHPPMLSRCQLSRLGP